MGAYVGDANCTNPLFAASLPSSAGDELCALPKGPRGTELVVFAIIGGVPESLATANPDWNKIVGADPGNFDFSGIDPHMVHVDGRALGALCAERDTRRQRRRSRARARMGHGRR